jgi:hypothetical protein
MLVRRKSSGLELDSSLINLTFQKGDCSPQNVQFAGTVTDLGIVMDSQLNMSAHVTAVCHFILFQLRQLRAVRHSLSTDA